MITRIAAFSHKGVLIAKELQLFLNMEDNNICFFNREDYSGNELHSWVSESFKTADRIVFIGAVQIAVRLISKEIVSKLSDPAVVSIDDNGKYCIPILSGHLGSANEFALQISDFLGSQPVITTATDINNKFAVDIFAKKNNLYICNPERIKTVSGKILSEHKIIISSDYPISGYVPNNVSVDNSFDCDVYISSFKSENNNSLFLVPKNISIGVGCKKDIDSAYMQECFYDFLDRNRIAKESVARISSIDIKKDENAIDFLGKSAQIPLEFYSADELKKVEGNFSSSDFVNSITGVDNVCERSAAVNLKGEMLVRKTKYNGITFAAFIKFVNITFGE